MLVYLSCECGKQAPVSEGAAGTSLPCECGRTIKVPSLGELRQRVTEGDVPYFPAQAKAPPHPVSKAMRIGCAGLVFLFGVALFIGNKTGLFPTIPYAGYLVMGFGALLIGAAAADKSRSETQLERAFRLNIRSKLRDYREWSKARKLLPISSVQWARPRRDPRYSPCPSRASVGVLPVAGLPSRLGRTPGPVIPSRLGSRQP
jgi:hypothetical protein